jgi:hypothetical protein
MLAVKRRTQLAGASGEHARAHQGAAEAVLDEESEAEVASD